MQEAWEKDALFMMKKSAAAIAPELRRLERSGMIGDRIRADQLRLAQRAILEEQGRLWQAIGSSVQAAKAEAAAAAVEALHVYDDMLLTTVYTPLQRDALLRAAQAQARRGVDNAMSRFKGYSKIPLSDQVWRTKAFSNDLIDRRIHEALATGKSARELAASVRDLIRPDTPGGVKYAAMRLGRTEINNAAHATTVRQNAKKPWVTGMRWELSGSHPKPDDCNAYAEESHYPGGPEGVFRPEEVPEKPHPNCLCYIIPEMVTDEEFIDQFASGKYDEYLDGVMSDAGYPPLPKVPTRCP